MNETMRNLYCLDIETGGIEFGTPVIEVAYGSVFGDDLTVLWNDTVMEEHCDPEALKVNRCFARDRIHDPQTIAISVELWLAEQIQFDLEDKVIVAANPQFDVGHLADLLRRHRLEPSWSYRLIDIKSLCVGFMAARGGLTPMPEKGWGQKEVAEMMGVPLIPAALAHTAAGDVEQLRQLARMVLGGDA